MKVTCIKNVLTGAELKAAVPFRDSDQHYPIIVGKDYKVMGIALYKDTNCLHYLVDDHDRPFWYPHFLFDISEHSLPINWFSRNFDTNITKGDLLCISGFYELCMNDDFHDALIEREKWALQIYIDKKNESINNSSE